MQASLLKNIVSVIIGQQAHGIVDFLYDKKNVNEFLIAKKLKLTINQTRNLLYKLTDEGIVSFIRKKDKKKGGWYTYFWKLENLKALEFLKDILIKKIENLSNQIRSRETKVFYVCKNCHVEYNEENALLHDFTCPECGEVFIKSDNAKILKDLKKEDEKLKKELAIIDEELGKEKEVVEKKRIKEKDKFEKEKKDKRKKALLKLKKLRKKTEKKPVKKIRKKAKKKHSKKIKKKNKKRR